VHGPTIRMTSGLPVEELLDGLGEGRGGRVLSSHARVVILRIIVISRSKREGNGPVKLEEFKRRAVARSNSTVRRSLVRRARRASGANQSRRSGGSAPRRPVLGGGTLALSVGTMPSVAEHLMPAIRVPTCFSFR
jgi:hypothetical protein